jgi:short-subunit dehydrogenase
MREAGRNLLGHPLFSPHQPQAGQPKESAMRQLQGSTVVITGASSGIGRASALAFADAGANVVLLARRERALDELAAECSRKGVRALAVPTDVTDPDAVRQAANTAARITGRIDVWINNAGIGAVGRFTDTPVEAHDQVVLTNLIGYMHGVHAVLPYFQRQPSGGVLINTISFGGWVPAPFAAAYTASKFGLRGLSESLRSELGGYPQIHICDVFPSFIDTPGVQHAGNYTGRALKPAPPVYAPERVADTMVSLARNPRPSATVGVVATLARLGYGVLPGFSRWAMRKFFETYLAQASESRVTAGNLFRSSRQGALPRGGWRAPKERTAVAAAGLSALLLAGVLVARAGKRSV